MIPFFVDYASPSVIESDRQRALLGLTASARRPLRFRGRVKQEGRLLLRFALQTLGQVIWSSDHWRSSGNLDPVISVFADRLAFEAFSGDLSAYVRLDVDRGLFETEGDVVLGTTNVDFTAWLWAALGELRSSRETWLSIDPAGFDVQTKGSGGRFQEKVEVPEAWVRGFLAIQGAMALPGTRLSVRPVDLLSAIRYLSFTKAKVSPRALRYELTPGQDARLVLEPWEHQVPLVGASHSYAETRVIRTWGRRRLSWLSPLLPHADRVDVYLKGRAMPSFYVVKLGPIQLLLGLSGWSANHLAGSGGLGLLGGVGPRDAGLEGRALAALSARELLRPEDFAKEVRLEVAAASSALTELVRRGRAIYELEARAFRRRELFEQPIDVQAVFPPDPQVEASQALLAGQKVVVLSCAPRETRKLKRLKSPDGVTSKEVIYREWVVSGRAGAEDNVEIVVHEEGRIIFGTCGCPFFLDGYLSRGPCAHLLALLAASEPQRGDLPASVPAPEQTSVDMSEEGDGAALAEEED